MHFIIQKVNSFMQKKYNFMHKYALIACVNDNGVSI